MSLYLIQNFGCDASTTGLANLSDTELDTFKKVIRDLNKNSYYGCMPTIEIYKIDESCIVECEYNKDLSVWDEGHVDRDELLYLNDKTYTFADGYDKYTDFEQVL